MTVIYHTGLSMRLKLSGDPLSIKSHECPIVKDSDLETVVFSCCFHLRREPTTLMGIHPLFYLFIFFT